MNKPVFPGKSVQNVGFFGRLMPESDISPLSMKYSHNADQQSFFSLGQMEVELPQEHPLIRMADTLPWEAMVEEAAACFSAKTGRNSNSLRMMLGVEIAKRELGLSDEKIIEQVQTDVALKYFCGFRSWHHAVPDASSMTNFRKRIPEPVLQKIEDLVIRSFMRHVPRRKRGQVIPDTTCQEADIAFPTDTGLLRKTWQKLTGVAKTVRMKGGSLVIRGTRTLRNAVRAFDLKRQKSKPDILKMRKKLVREGMKLITKIGKVVKESGVGLSASAQRIMATAREVLRQQREMIRGKTNRVAGIVSFHAPEVRPIVRGKAGKNTEFGKKVTVNVIGGALIQSAQTADGNFSDTEMIASSIARYEAAFRKPPRELIADRGGHSPENHDLLKEKQIRDGIAYRGKIPRKAELPPPAARKRMRRQRSTVEGKIGTYKRRGGSRCRYGHGNTQAWISFGMIAMNVAWAIHQVT